MYVVVFSALHPLSNDTFVVDDDTTEDYETLSVLNGHVGDVKNVRFHPNREVLATLSYNFRSIPRTWFLLVTQLLASCSYDDSVRTWAAEDEDDEWASQHVLSSHSSIVWDFSFDVSGNRIGGSILVNIYGMMRLTLDPSGQ